MSQILQVSDPQTRGPELGSPDCKSSVPFSPKPHLRTIQNESEAEARTRVMWSCWERSNLKTRLCFLVICLTVHYNCVVNVTVKHEVLSLTTFSWRTVVLTSPVVFFSWLFWWSREETELLLLPEEHLDTQNKHYHIRQTDTHTEVEFCSPPSQVRCVQVSYLTELLRIPLARLVFSSSWVSENKQNTISGDADDKPAADQSPLRGSRTSCGCNKFL